MKLLLLTILLLSLPALAADPPDKGKGKQTHIFAKLKSGKQKWELTPNSLGIFPVVITTTNTPVEIEIHYPKANEGDLAVIAIRDGGVLTAQVPGGGKGKGSGQTVSGSTIRSRISGNGKLELTFNYGTEFHHQRISVEVGGTRTTFEFHVDH